MINLESIEAMSTGDALVNGLVTVKRLPDTKTGKRVYRTTLYRETPLFCRTAKTYSAETALENATKWPEELA